MSNSKLGSIWWTRDPIVAYATPYSHRFFLLLWGLLLVNPALTTLAMVLYVSVDFSSAAREEEVLLSQELPEYVQYMERTGRFFPKWW